MANRIEKSFKVWNKTVTVIYELSFYSQRNYKMDFQDFLDYQTKKERVASADELDWKFYNVNVGEYIPYNDFANILSSALTQIFFQILRNDPSIMVSDEPNFRIYFIVAREPKRNWYFLENPGKDELTEDKYPGLLNEIESENSETAIYLVAGSFLLQAVVWPYKFRKRINYQYISRYLVHEFEHHKQTMSKFFSHYDKIEARLKERFKIKLPRLPRIINQRISYTFFTFQELLIEGLADFVTIGNRKSIDIHMDYIYQFRRNLDALATMDGHKKIEEFWIENLSYGTFAGGAYYCGKIMCFTIALAIAKKYNLSPFIYLENKEEFSLGELDKLMSRHKILYVQNPDSRILKMAYEQIRKTGYNYRKFILLYESSCRQLGIRKRNMVVWYGLFDDLKKEATKFYKRYPSENRYGIRKKIKSIIKSITRSQKDYQEL